MFWAMSVTGAMAAIRVSPVFVLLTMVMIAVLVRERRRRRLGRTAVAAAETTLGELPPRVQSAVDAAVAQLPAGDARKLLGAVVRQARPLFGTPDSRFDDARNDESRAHASDLVVASCDTALELARLDTLVESGSRATGAAKGNDAALDGRYAAARQQFATRLTAAAAALGELYASGIEHGTPASDRVAELAAELTEDAASRNAAQAEMDELLK